MTRLFVAIELPESVRSTLTEMDRRVSGAKWTRPEQLHLTLNFIGEVTDATMEDVKTILAEVRGSPLTLRFGPSGTFGSKASPRVIWIGVEHEPALMKAQAAIEEALASIGIQPEARAYTPHITLARLKKADPAEVAAHVHALDALELPPVAVDRFVLFKSVLTPKQAVHSIQAEFPFVQD